MWLVSICLSMVLSKALNASLVLKVNTALLRVWAQLMVSVMLVTSVWRVRLQLPSKDAQTIISVLKVHSLRFHALLVSSLLRLVRRLATLALMVITVEEPQPKMIALLATTVKTTDSSHVLLVPIWIQLEMYSVCQHPTLVNLTPLNVWIANRVMVAVRLTPRPNALLVSIVRLVQLLLGQTLLLLIRRWEVCVCQVRSVVLVSLPRHNAQGVSIAQTTRLTCRFNVQLVTTVTSGPQLVSLMMCPSILSSSLHSYNRLSFAVKATTVPPVQMPSSPAQLVPTPQLLALLPLPSVIHAQPTLSAREDPLFPTL